MRKNAKERKIIKNQSTTFRNNDNEVINYIKILVVLLILVVAFTLLTIAITNKKPNKEETKIQYSKILVGSILNKEEESYYVLASTSKDENVDKYENYINEYLDKDEHISFYIVDLDSGFNSIYFGEEEILEVEKISDIRFKQTTLLKIENKKIIQRITDKEEIDKFLKDLSA